MWAFRERGYSFPSLQVFQEAANLFLDLLGKLLAQPDDSEQTLRRESLMVMCTLVQISVSDIFPCFSLSLSYNYTGLDQGNRTNIYRIPTMCHMPHEYEKVPTVKGLVV